MGPECVVETGHDVLLCISTGSTDLFSTERSPSCIQYWRFGSFELMNRHVLQPDGCLEQWSYWESARLEPQKFCWGKESLLNSIVACSIAWH